MTGCAVTCLKEKRTKKKKKSTFWLWGTEAQNGTFSLSQQKFTFIHWKSNFHGICLIERNKICLFIPTSCLLLSLAVCLSLRAFSFLSVDRKKSSLLLHLSQAGLWCLWSRLLSLSLGKLPHTFSYVAFERLMDNLSS